MARLAVVARQVALEKTIAEDDDDDEAIESWTKAVKCANSIVVEMDALLHMTRTGFVGKPPEDGPPSEVASAKQQGKLAVQIYEERTRVIKFGIGDAESADAARRRQLREAMNAQQ